MAGGGLFNHLDYSFVAGHEDGTFVYPASQPGGGNPGFRRQMKVLAEFLGGFEFVRMRPDPALVAGGVPAGHRIQVLAEPGRAYALYLARDTKDKNAPTGRQTATLQLALPAGDYTVEWVTPGTGDRSEAIGLHASQAATLVQVPAFEADLAARIRRR